MASDTENTGEVKLPPKLDLRKQGILRSAPTVAGGEGAAVLKPKIESARLTVPGTDAADAGEARSAAASGQESAPAEAGTPAAAKPLEIRAAAPRPLQPLGSGTKLAGPPAAGVGEARPLSAKPLAAKPVISRPAEPGLATSAPTAEQGEPLAASAEGPRKPAGKTETSRIPLEMAKARPVLSTEPVTPKTIRIKPGVPVPPRKATQPLQVTQLPVSADDELDKAALEKRKTSRIPLDAALASERKEGESAAPKTIRLKRPGETVEKVPEAPEAGPKPTGTDTSLLDKTDSPPAEETPTRRKTIRVKRPTDGPEMKSAGIPTITVAEAEAPQGNEPGWVFAVPAAAAVVVICVVIWMLAAQAYGPNASLTSLSYNVSGPALSWPGKVPPAR